MARLKVEEAQRERRLREVLERVSQAERRAKEAEQRALAAESAAVKAAEWEAAKLAASDPPEDGGTADGQNEGNIDLNRATFEQLRDLGFSVTQSTRLLTHRERQGGFDSVDDLKGVSGMPDELLDEVQAKLRIG